MTSASFAASCTQDASSDIWRENARRRTSPRHLCLRREVSGGGCAPMHHEWSARLSSGFRMGSGSYSVLVAKRYRQGSCRSLQLLLEEFDEGHDERALREEHAGHPRDELDGLARERESEVHLRHKVRGVQLFQGFGDALGLRAGETFGFEFLDDPVGV